MIKICVIFLVSLFSFDRRDGGSWIRDHEQPDVNLIATWLKKYTNSWKKLLERTDEEMGLYCAISRPGAYREILVDLLKKHQEYLNNSVLVKFDAGSPKKVRITIFPPEKVPKSPARKRTTPQKKQEPGSPTAVAGVDTSLVSNPTSSPLQQVTGNMEQLPVFSQAVAGSSTTASPGSTKSPSRKRATPKKKKDIVGSPTPPTPVPTSPATQPLPSFSEAVADLVTSAPSNGLAKTPSIKRKTPQKLKDAPDSLLPGVPALHRPDTPSTQLQQPETLHSMQGLPVFSSSVAGFGTSAPCVNTAVSSSDNQPYQVPVSSIGTVGFGNSVPMMSPPSNQPMPQNQQEFPRFPVAHADVDTCALAGASTISPAIEQSIPQMKPDSSTSEGIEGIDTSDVFGGPSMVRVLEDEFTAANLVQLQHDS